MSSAAFTRSTLTRRAALAMAGGATASSLFAREAMAGNRAARATPEAFEHEVFFGWVLGSTNIIAVAIDASSTDEAGDRLIKAYVCDGLGQPDGIALWFKATMTPGTVATFTAVGDGGEILVIDALRHELATGSFKDGNGVTLRFASFRAIDGAGIYDVTLDDQLVYAGTSTEGTILAAQADEEGNVVGTLTAVDGTVVPFSVHVLSKASETELAARGLPQRFRDFADVSIIPDSYVAVISPGGAFWLGRSGDVRGGSGGTNIIGLDMMD